MEPSRKLGARLPSRQDLVDVIHAALNGELAFLPFDTPPPGRARYPVSLHAPGVAEAVELVAQIAGEPMGTAYPVVLMVSTDRQREKLRKLAVTLRHPASGVSEAARASHAPPTANVERPVASRGPRVSVTSTVSAHPAPRSETPPRDSGEVMREPSPDGELIGRELGDGRYRIEQLLGVGGMGRVYLARQLSLSKPVAVKVLDQAYATDPLFTARFHQEALAASQLDHRNAMTVLDFGQEPDGLLYITMELLEGESLAHVLARNPKLPAGRVLPIMTQVCAALAAAHEQGIVHRDIKPENIVVHERIDDDGNVVEFVKVCDFGLAKMQHDANVPKAAQGRKLTIAGQVMGTPDYMAPEQCRGDVVDARADIYACGVILFELSTGRVPFEADNPMEVLGLHIMAPPPAPRSLDSRIDPRLEALILKALQKDPGARHQTARELRDELQALKRDLSLRPSAPTVASDPLTASDPGATADPFFASQSSSPKITPAPYIADPGIAGPGKGSSGQHRLDGLARQIDFGDGEDEGRPSFIPIDMEKAPASLKAAGGDPASSAPPSAAEVEQLGEVATASLGTDAALRKAAYRRLLDAGVSGFWALYRARQGTSLDEETRQRWVAMIRDFTQRGLGAVSYAISQIDLTHPAGIDDALAEDLLHVLPTVRDPAAAEQAARFLEYRSPLVRRAAVSALVHLRPPDVATLLSRALDDRDGGVRLLVTRAYRKISKVGAVEVEKLTAIIDDTGAPDEVRASAAYALARVAPSAQADAELALLHALEGRRKSPSFVRMFSGRGPEDGPLFLEAAAKVLLRLSGPEIKPAIARRAKACKGEARERLQRVLAGG